MADLVFTNPLTEDDLAKLNAALDGAKLAKTHINMAKRAGLDVTAQEAAVKDLEDRVQKIKAVYFPNR